jgi:ADP-ribose pyrophosphatase
MRPDSEHQPRSLINYAAQTLGPISTFYSSKSVCQETAHLYIGRDLVQAEAKPDETEFLEVARRPFAEVLDLVRASEIRDSMTVIAVLHTAQLRNS